MEPTKEQIEAALNQSDEITDWLPETKRYYRSDYQNSIIDLAAAYRAEHERAEPSGKVKCDICGKRVKRAGLKMHKRDVHGEE